MTGVQTCALPIFRNTPWTFFATPVLVPGSVTANAIRSPFGVNANGLPFNPRNGLNRFTDFDLGLRVDIVDLEADFILGGSKGREVGGVVSIASAAT